MHVVASRSYLGEVHSCDVHIIYFILFTTLPGDDEPGLLLCKRLVGFHVPSFSFWWHCSTLLPARRQETSTQNT